MRHKFDIIPAEAIIAVDNSGVAIWLDASGYAETTLDTYDYLETEQFIEELPPWEHKRCPLSVWQFIGEATLNYDVHEGVEYVDSVDWEGTFKQLWKYER